jgi:RNA polymerase sigma-70 factor, ECF subfamily
MTIKTSVTSSDKLSALDVTRLLKAWRGGDGSALERLTPLVYAELHRLARLHMAAERDGHMLQSSALVNEAYLRLIGETQVADWQDRNHFFAVSARLMRQILIDFARAQQTQKRGNRAPHLDLTKVWNLPASSRTEFSDLDDALTRLAEVDSRQAQIVELRFFGGLEMLEIADVLGISESSVRRDWRLARLWLYDALTAPEPGPSPLS